MTDRQQSTHRRLAAMRRAGYRGPSYLLGRAVFEYVSDQRRFDVAG